MSRGYNAGYSFRMDERWTRFSNKFFREDDSSLETGECECKWHTEGSDNEYETKRAVYDYTCRRCKCRYLEERKKEINELLFYHSVKGATPETMQKRLDEAVAKLEDAEALKRKIAELEAAAEAARSKKADYFATNEN